MSLAAFATFPAIAAAQAPTMHSPYGLELPPGVIGQRLLQNRPNLLGHMQAVELRGPVNSEASIAADGAFSGSHIRRVTASIEVGRVYRFRISQIPNYPGASIYPTVELIDRLHPPPGLEQKFPVRIVIPQEDLEMAIKGRMVTRVVYVEDPRDPYPFPDQRDDQRYFDTLPGENPLHVARQMGRPIAIVRIGSRTPDGQLSNDFLFGSPPVNLYESSEPLDQQPLAPIVNRLPKSTEQLPAVPELPDTEPDAGDVNETIDEPVDDESAASPLDNLGDGGLGDDANAEDLLPDDAADEGLDDGGIFEDFGDGLPDDVGDDLDLDVLDEL